MASLAEIAELLTEIATLKRLAGENEFRAAAFDKAARLFEALPGPIPDAGTEDWLKELPGVGDSIRREVLAYLETGDMPERKALRDSIPAGLLEWLRVPGLGPKRIRKIHEELGITALPDLLARCRDGAVAALAGFGEKSAAKIAASIEFLAKNAERCHLDLATALADRFLARLRPLPGVEAAEPAGSLRRSLETVGDVDLLVSAPPEHTAAIMQAFTEGEGVTEILARGDTKASVRVAEGRQVDLRVVAPDAFGAALLYFTGSKDHNVLLRGRARERGLALNEYGLFHLDAKGETDFERPVKAGDEAALYRALGLPFIPPELREMHGELEWFAEHRKADLVEIAQIRGILHAHSRWSDGAETVRAMAEACRERGYGYLGITDHSRAAAYAHGLSIDRVRQQWKEIDDLNAAYTREGVDFRVFKGIESDILADGSLDYPEEILAGFDFVIASVHSQLDMPPDEMLARLQAAATHPRTTIIGHPTGRLLLRRPGNAFDMDRLIETCAAHGTAIEINANPWRLDLDWRHGRKARDAGLMSSINPDAHAPAELDHVRYGVGIARKGWFDAARILNTRKAGELEDWFRAPKAKRLAVPKASLQ